MVLTVAEDKARHEGHARVRRLDDHIVHRAKRYGWGGGNRRGGSHSGERGGGGWNRRGWGGNGYGGGWGYNPYMYGGYNPWGYGWGKK
uniref:Uncharacterized protein n=1 Tax=Acrobeloides nanus TaxID=290746 RepID=A0A914CT98_9BILA